MMRVWGLFVVFGVISGGSGFEQYPIECIDSQGRLRLTLGLGEYAQDASVEYSPERKLIVKAGNEAEKLTFTVEQCVAYLVITHRSVDKTGVEGDLVVSCVSRSSTATYPYILPFCVADAGALYITESDRITLILLPADKAAV